MNTASSDVEMQVRVEKIVAPQRQMLSEVVGHTGTGLHRHTLLGPAMDNLLWQFFFRLTRFAEFGLPWGSQR